MRNYCYHTALFDVKDIALAVVVSCFLRDLAKRVIGN